MSTYEQALQYALRSLRSGPKTRKHLAQLIASRGYDVKVSALVLERLDAMGYLNDALLAENFMQTCLAKHYSALRIQQEFTRKGFRLQDFNSAAQKYDLDNTEKERCYQAARLAHEKYQGDPRKMQRFLRSRGFTDELILQILAEQLNLYLF